MSARIQTNKTAQLEFNSQILDFNGQTLTFYVKGLTHWDVDAFSYVEEDMGAATITLDLLVPADVDPLFGLDWYVDFRGERFYNKSLKPSCVKDTTSLQYRYSMTFLSQRADLERYEFANFVTEGLTAPQPTSYDFTLPLTVDEFKDRFNINLAHNLNEDWSMVLDGDYMSNLNDLLYDGTSRVTVNFSRVTLWAILTQLYDIYGLRWSIAPNLTGMRITVGATPAQLSQTFEYGSGNGLVSIERINPDTPIYTRLSGVGADRNVPYRYFDSSTADFPADPDNNEFTRLIPYPNIMPTCYRDYVQGWNDGSIASAVAKSTYGYSQGYWDASSGGVFNPVDFAISANEATYGIRKGSVENADTIYPTIQGVTDASIGRIDEILAVEAVINDNYDTSVAVALAADMGFQSWLPYNGTETNANDTVNFELTDALNEVAFSIVQNFRNESLTGSFNEDVSISLIQGTTVVDSFRWTRVSETLDNATVSRSFTDVPAGTYHLRMEAVIVNHYTGGSTTFTTILSDIHSVGASVFSPTFDIWIKNIWDTSIGADTSIAYIHRVWDPIVAPTTSGEMTVNFSDGLMAGDEYEFIVLKPENTENYLIAYDTTKSVGGVQSEWRLTLKKSDANLDSTKLYLPNKTINASIGDHFFFTGIELPQTYVEAAEQRVQDYLDNELAKVSDEFPTYAIDPSPIFLATFAEVQSLKVGAGVPLQDARLIGVAPYVFFITTLTIEYSKGKLLPKWSLTISEKPVSKSTTISLIQGDLKVLSSSMRSAQDTVAMVDAVLQQTYLKKDGTDQYSLSPTTFAKQVTTEAGMKSDDFVKAQIGGAGYAVVKDENGNWMLEIDKLNVRMSLNVNELIVNQISIYGGKHMFTAAAMTVSEVEVQQSNIYVCHLDLKQGTVINQFVAGDLAYCQRYDPQSNAVIKDYWAKVMAVSSDSITLNFAGANYNASSVGIPAIGDNIAQLGNVSVPARQSAFIIDQLNGGQCTQYAGISAFTMSGKDQVSYGYDPSTHRAYQRTYGDMYVGERDQSNYLKFDSSTGVISYRGVITQDSTVIDSSGNSSNVTMDRGSYDASAQYFPGNTVAWLGSTYRCDVKPPIGAAPTDPTYWHVSAAKGTDGTNGTSVSIIRSMPTSSYLPLFWDSSTSYNAGNQCIFSDVIYTSLAGHINHTPPNVSYWEVYGNIAVGDGWIAADTGHLWVWTGSDWTDAGQIQGDPGNDGKGISSLTLYYLATDASTGITTASDFTDYVQVMTLVNKYLWTYQHIVYTDAAVWNSTPAITGVYGATGADGSTGATGAGGVAIICDKQNLAVTPVGNDFTAAVTVRLSKGSAYIPKADWTSQGHTQTDVSVGTDSSTSDSYTINLTGFSASTTQVGYVSVSIVYLGTTFTISISVSRIFNPVNVQKGLWITGTEYTGNCIQRDNVKDPDTLNYYSLRPTVGLLTSATKPHDDLTRWELLNSYKNVATETLLAENANIAGFIYKDEKMVSQSGTIGGDASTNWSNADFVPNLTLDGSTGEIIAKVGTFEGTFAGELVAASGTFAGALSAVTGTFSELQAAGDPSVEITLGTLGLTFGGNMAHQGVDASGNGWIFRTNNLWCRGVFGSDTRTAVVVTGANADYYPYGLGGPYLTVVLESVGSGGSLYYKLPLYGISGIVSGLPIDLVIFRLSVACRYWFTYATQGKKITLINANDDIPAYFYYHGTPLLMNGGVTRDCMFMGDLLLPAQTPGILGYGMILGTECDNNW